MEQPQRQPEIRAEHEIAVGRGRIRDRAEMHDGVELAPREPLFEIAGRHHVGELPFLQVPASP